MEYLLIMLLVIVTIFLGKVGTWFGFSEVVGQLFSGIILGSSILNIVQSSHLMALMSRLWTGFFGTESCRTPKIFQNPDFSLKRRDFWVFV
ncbi:hypothetical protein BMS93_09120 [Leuconostoc pseudomesenteroides]|nr:hypothetical protein BMS80_09905 [Leuconostoc pseudomesenteroides]ORI49842.1 hypothetical protein BMS85_09795 [Leuconostoc pseudomesenteroides]ORI50319.1 hypothetical protein BMS86_09340 [Leuconostoc pseudomesenteroides]ORI52817.1 hypothetical protein BMS87_09415 [Leuconostoc pseudomesenteroides]ORI55630.1 hypothetical protein BMS88_09930 [Leuconostoc pseudomesenteroides]